LRLKRRRRRRRKKKVKIEDFRGYSEDVPLRVSWGTFSRSPTSNIKNE